MNTTMNYIKQHGAPRSGERHTRIFTSGRASGRVLAALTITACFGALMNSPAQAQTYVKTSGDFAPEPDNYDRQYRLVESAITAPRVHSDIKIRPGTYREAFTADEPCFLKPTTSGTVTIGDLTASATTTLKITTVNTHLFGDLAIGDGTFEDDARAVDIGEICAASDWDVVAFQEIWDEDLFLGGPAPPARPGRNHAHFGFSERRSR